MIIIHNTYKPQKTLLKHIYTDLYWNKNRLLFEVYAQLNSSNILMIMGAAAQATDMIASVQTCLQTPNTKETFFVLRR